MAVVSLAFVLTMSRGIWAAVICGAGVGLVWKITTSNRFARVGGINLLFPIFILIYLGAIIVYVYLGPARALGGTSQSYYGTNSRSELLSRGAYFLADYPLTGGGLNSFPGLYSQYMIVIPYFYFINSYNLFLDVGIEQGIVGGLCFIFIYLGSIWLVSLTIIKSKSHEGRFLGWLGLLALIVTVVHGLFYDYFYYNGFSILALFPVGFSMAWVLSAKKDEYEHIQSTALSFIFKNNSICTLIYVLLLSFAVVTVFNTNKIISVWYANLGAVQMSQVELNGFPNNSWIGKETVPKLDDAEKAFRLSLQFDPLNRTANQRLGMIAMYQMDFELAIEHLEIAHRQAPKHRGIIKSLSYSYLWSGNLQEAYDLFIQLPEIGQELSVYIWWWDEQGRSDLSDVASLTLENLNTMYPSP